MRKNSQSPLLTPMELLSETDSSHFNMGLGHAHSLTACMWASQIWTHVAWLGACSTALILGRRKLANNLETNPSSFRGAAQAQAGEAIAQDQGRGCWKKWIFYPHLKTCSQSTPQRGLVLSWFPGHSQHRQCNITPSGRRHCMVRMLGFSAKTGCSIPPSEMARCVMCSVLSRVFSGEYECELLFGDSEQVGGRGSS